MDLPHGGEPLATQAHKSSRPARISGNEPVRVIGPYWAKHALLVPVGGEHLVVFGNDEPIRDRDGTLVSEAAQLVADLHHVPPAKLLGDELELVHALRDLIEYRADKISETLRHIATKVAEPLGCEVGAVLIRLGEDVAIEVVTRDWPNSVNRAAASKTLSRLLDQSTGATILEPELKADPSDALGRNDGLVARLTLPIGRPQPFGILVVAHAAEHPRGFTNLCLRIGHSLAEVAESLLAQAISREELAADRDRLAREARTDPLTGLANRAAWMAWIAHEEARRKRYGHPVTIVSADLNRLKEVNDQYGHAAGDRLLSEVAAVLVSQARIADRVSRVGGDEFLILMPETDSRGGRRFIARVRKALRAPESQGRDLDLSLGSATSRLDEPLEQVVARADRAMYAAKKGTARKHSSSDASADLGD